MTIALLDEWREWRDEVRAVENVRKGGPPWPLMGDDLEVISLATQLIAFACSLTLQGKVDDAERVRAFLADMRGRLAEDVERAAVFAEQHGGHFKAKV